MEAVTMNVRVLVRSYMRRLLAGEVKRTSSVAVVVPATFTGEFILRIFVFEGVEIYRVPVATASFSVLRPAASTSHFLEKVPVTFVPVPINAVFFRLPASTIDVIPVTSSAVAEFAD